MINNDFARYSEMMLNNPFGETTHYPEDAVYNNE